MAQNATRQMQPPRRQRHSDDTVPIEAVELRGSKSFSFSFSIFSEQAVYQILYPISVPLIYALRGRAAVTNMRFNCSRRDDPSSQLVTSFFQLHLAVLWLAILAVWANLPPPSEHAAEVEVALFACLNLEVITVTVAAVFQRVAVATKYATLPLADYTMLMTREATYARLAADQLLVGWSAVGREVLDRELDQACVRTGLAPDSAAFKLTAQQVQDLRAVLQHEELEAKEAKADAAARAMEARRSRSTERHLGRAASRTHRRALTRHPSLIVLAQQPKVHDSATAGAPTAALDSLQAVAPGVFPHNHSVAANPTLQTGGSYGTVAVSSTVSTSRASVSGRDEDVDCWDGTGPHLGVLLRPARPGTADDREAAGTPPDALVGLPAFWLARALFRRSDDRAQVMSGRVNVAVIMASIVLAAIPAAVRAACGVPVGGLTSSYTFIFVISGYLNMMFPLIVFSYMRVGLVDYWRRANVMRWLIKLASRRYEAVEVEAAAADVAPGIRGGASMGAAPPLLPLKRIDSLFFDLADGAVTATHTLRLHEPVLTLDKPANAVAWLATRRLLSSLGKRYFRRVSIYTSQALLVALGITLALLIQLLLQKPSSLVSSAPTVSFALLAVWDLGVLAALLVGMLLYGAQANATASEGVALLAARQLEVAQRAACAAKDIGDGEGSHNQLEILKETEVVLARAAAVLGHHAMLEPVTILSVPATQTLVNTLAAGFVSAVGLGLQLLRGLLQF